MLSKHNLLNLCDATCMHIFGPDLLALGSQLSSVAYSSFCRVEPQGLFSVQFCTCIGVLLA